MSLPSVEWLQRAECRDLPPAKIDELFFPVGTRSGVLPEAAALCAKCPVIAQCKALGEGQIGVWAGERHTHRNLISQGYGPGRSSGGPKTADIEFFKSIGMNDKWIEQKLNLNPDTLAHREYRAKEGLTA